MTEKVKRYMDFMGGTSSPATRRVSRVSRVSSDPLAARPVTRVKASRSAASAKTASVKPTGKPLKTASPSKDADALARKAAAALSGSNLKTSSALNYTLNGKSPFLSSYNIEKRPLSDSIKEKKVEEIPKKNVYQKETPPDKKSKSAKKGPVVVIDESKKSSGLSLAIIILLTILVGAAVGAGAYFLLPK